MGVRGELFSAKYSTQYGQRTYFFNIKENRFGDIFLSIVESVKKDNSDLSFRRHQIAVFDTDWPAFLGFLDKATEHLAAEDFTWRCRMISGNNKRSYELGFNRKTRITRVMINEKKDSQQDQSVHVVSIDAADFNKFKEVLSQTLAQYKENIMKSAVL